jgi:hypothetical protein
MVYIRALIVLHFTTYRTYTNAECGIFQVLGKHNNKATIYRPTPEISSRFDTANSAFKTKKTPFQQQI